MNVVFDFGGVLFRWKPHEFLGRLLPQHVPDEAAAHEMVQEFFQGYRGDWGEFDRGTIEPEPLARRIAERTRLPLADVKRVIEAVPQELQPIEATVALLLRLHEQEVPLYYLSNMPEPYARHLEETHGFLELFRAGVFSARVKLIKPEAAIFEHAARVLGLDPRDTVFIDDMADNIAAARDAGWHGIVFTGADDCAVALRRLGLPVRCAPAFARAQARRRRHGAQWRPW